MMARQPCQTDVSTRRLPCLCAAFLCIHFYIFILSGASVRVHIEVKERLNSGASARSLACLSARLLIRSFARSSSAERYLDTRDGSEHGGVGVGCGTYLAPVLIVHPFPLFELLRSFARLPIHSFVCLTVYTFDRLSVCLFFHPARSDLS